MTPPATVHLAVVDDDDQLRLLARMLIDDALSDVQHRITEIADGQEAIDLCDRERVDIMVLDVHMPKVRGHEVLDSLREADSPPRVIAWSADEQELRVAAAHGAYATVIKGASGGSLMVAVRSCLFPRLRSLIPALREPRGLETVPPPRSRSL